MCERWSSRSEFIAGADGASVWLNDAWACAEKSHKSPLGSACLTAGAKRVCVSELHCQFFRNTHTHTLPGCCGIESSCLARPLCVNYLIVLRSTSRHSVCVCVCVCVCLQLDVLKYFKGSWLKHITPSNLPACTLTAPLIHFLCFDPWLAACAGASDSFSSSRAAASLLYFTVWVFLMGN